MPTRTRARVPAIAVRSRILELDAFRAHLIAAHDRRLAAFRLEMDPWVAFYRRLFDYTKDLYYVWEAWTYVRVRSQPIPEWINEVIDAVAAGQRVPGIRIPKKAARDLQIATHLRHLAIWEPTTPISAIVLRLAERFQVSDRTVYRAWDHWRQFVQLEYPRDLVRHSNGALVARTAVGGVHITLFNGRIKALT